MLIILFTNAITNATLPTQYEWIQLSSLNLKNAQTISFKVFPFVKKSFPNHWHYFSCRLNLTIFADLRHSKQQFGWLIVTSPQFSCNSCLSVALSCHSQGRHGTFLRPITGHTPSDHNEAIFKLVKIFDRLFMNWLQQQYLCERKQQGN